MSILTNNDLPLIENNYLAEWYQKKAGEVKDILESIYYNKAVNDILTGLKNQHPLKTIYLDSDDVIFDWKGYMLDNHLHSFDNIADFNNLSKEVRNFVLDEIYEKDPTLFAKLPLLDGALELIEALRSTGVHIKILTATTVNHPCVEDVVIDKVNAFEELGFNPWDVIAVEKSKDKQEYVNKSCLLIDDFINNCERWRDGGGLAFHYKGKADIPEIIKLIKLYT